MVTDHTPSCNDPDPGNLIDQLGKDTPVRTDHRALDDGPHVTPEDVEHLEADRLLLARRRGGAA